MPTGWINLLLVQASALIATGLHTWTPLERTLGVLAAGFLGAAMLGRPLALLLRLALIVAGVLVAARLAGVGA